MPFENIKRSLDSLRSLEMGNCLTFIIAEVLFLQIKIYLNKNKLTIIKI